MLHQPVKELRQDITGLRAVAVLAVTLYHIAHVLDPENLYFQGGFLGVDIFFVISGFLMTKIIMDGLDRQNFSLYTFYKRRAKRICPALLVVVVTFVCVALLISDTASLMRSLRDGLRALGFISNMWLARQTGYFDGAATERIFLHTWSLSVEWQFYLLYPLILMLLTKFIARTYVGRVLVCLTIASLVFGCVFTLYSPTLSYFYLPSRAYELLIGALAYFYPLSVFIKSTNTAEGSTSEQLQSKTALYAEAIGLGCILLSLFIVDSSAGWPNAWSVLPLFGTYLCIAANNRKTLLSNVVFQKLGLWSYAIYLVHWPVVVLFGAFGNQSIVWGLLPVVLVLGMVLHYAVERRRNFGWIFLIIYLASAGTIQWLIKTDASVVRSINNLEMPAGSPGDTANKGNISHFGNQNRPVDFILVGDSFARQLIASLEKYDLHVITVIKDDCFSSVNFTSIHRNLSEKSIAQCKLRYNNLLKAAHENPDTPILWTQNWLGYGTFIDKNGQDISISFIEVIKQAVPQVLEALDNGQRRIYVAGVASMSSTKAARRSVSCYSLYSLKNVLAQSLYNLQNCSTMQPKVEQPVNHALREIFASLPQNVGKSEDQQHLRFIDIDQALCSEQKCRVMMEETKATLFFDGSHFSIYGANAVVPYILDEMSISTKLVN